MYTGMRRLITAAMCLLLPSVVTPQARSRITIAHWGTERILIYLPLYVAIDGGFIRRQGVEATLLYSGNDDQVFAAVRSGAADFGVGDPAFAAINRAKGGEGRVIAPLVTSLTNWGVSRAGSSVPQIDSFKQLAGLRLTSFPQPSTTYTVLSQINRTLGPDSFRIVQTAFGSELAAVSRGRADIAMLLEPQTSIAEANGYHVVLSLADKFGPFLLTGVTTTDGVLRSRSREATALLRGLDEAFRFIRANPDSAATIVSASFPTLDKRVVRAAVRRLLHDGAVPSTVIIPPTAWNSVLALRVQSGELPSLERASGAFDTATAHSAIMMGMNYAAPNRSPNTRVDSEPSSSVWWEWYSRIADTVGIISAAIIVFTWLRWLAGMRVLARHLSRRERVAVEALSPVLGMSGSTITHHEAVSRISAALPGQSQADVQDLIARLVRLRVLAQHGQTLRSPIDILERKTRVHLLTHAGRASADSES